MENNIIELNHKIKQLNNKFEIDKLTTNDFFKERYAYLRQHALNNTINNQTISETEKVKLMNELNYELCVNSDLIYQLVRRIKKQFAGMNSYINITEKKIPSLAKSIINCGDQLKRQYLIECF